MSKYNRLGSTMGFEALQIGFALDPALPMLRISGNQQTFSHHFIGGVKKHHIALFGHQGHNPSKGVLAACTFLE